MIGIVGGYADHRRVRNLEGVTHIVINIEMSLLA
jgi:hypothetical protein